jgi:hypothetical protein
LVARKLLAALMAGQIDQIGTPEIEQACDAANRAMIRRVDRAQLLDEATRRVVELATASPPLDRSALAAGQTAGDRP